MAPVSLAAKILRLSLAALLIVICLGSDSFAESSNEVVVFVGDTTAFPATTNTVISVFADNFPAADTIVGFKLEIRLNGPPNLVEFQTDSGISIDTTYWQCRG